MVSILCDFGELAEQDKCRKEDAHPAIILSISNPHHKHLQERPGKRLQHARYPNTVDLPHHHSRCHNTALEHLESAKSTVGVVLHKEGGRNGHSLSQSQQRTSHYGTGHRWERLYTKSAYPERREFFAWTRVWDTSSSFQEP